MKEEFVRALETIVKNEETDVVPVLSALPSALWMEIFNHVPAVRHAMLEHAHRRIEYYEMAALIAESTHPYQPD